MSNEQLDDVFKKTQVAIEELQVVQAAIDRERRLRYAASQKAVLDQKRAELAALEKSLEVAP
jgi:hypothetical protein